MPNPSPILFFETASAFQRTEALRAGVELDLFSRIAEGASTAAALAARCNASEKGMRILCDYLAIAGFLVKSKDGYSLTADSEVFLNRRSPAYMGGTLQFLLGSTVREAFRNLPEAVRAGGAAAGKGTMDPEHPVWQDFARAMAPMMAPAAEFIANAVETRGPVKVLDIAAGHGLFGLAFARRNASAQIHALDWSAVLQVAKENAQAAGVIDRYHTIPGSAFDVDFGTGYDVALFTNFFHHFEPARCEELMRKAHAALKPDGRAVTLEFVPNDDRISPPMPATFALTMLASTEQGDAYTFREYERMFGDSGFGYSEMQDVPGGPQRVIISHKAPRDRSE